nr:GDP-mannose 4,6-dehydratase [Bacillus subtilis]
MFGDGQQSRDFTYIGDCVKGITAVLGKPHLIGETVNIGGAERASVLKVVSLIEDISGRKATLHFSDKIAGEPSNTWADISKAKQLLHYDPATSLKDGLTNEIAYLSSLYQGE